MPADNGTAARSELVDDDDRSARREVDNERDEQRRPRDADQRSQSTEALKR
jgi:hypothetical protein